MSFLITLTPVLLPIAQFLLSPALWIKSLLTSKLISHMTWPSICATSNFFLMDIFRILYFLLIPFIYLNILILDMLIYWTRCILITEHLVPYDIEGLIGVLVFFFFPFNLIWILWSHKTPEAIIHFIHLTLILWSRSPKSPHLYV